MCDAAVLAQLAVINANIDAGRAENQASMNMSGAVEKGPRLHSKVRFRHYGGIIGETGDQVKLFVYISCGKCDRLFPVTLQSARILGIRMAGGLYTTVVPRL